MHSTSFKSTLVILIFHLASYLLAQGDNSNDLVHLKVQRLNDSYIDVYHNKPLGKKKLPVLLFCQGSGYDSNTEGFLGLLHQFDKKAVGLAIEKEGVKFGDDGTALSEAYQRTNTVYNRLYDYLRVFQYLKSYAPWWNGEVYVIGGSEGGLLAGMIASYYPNVKSVAILSFGGGLNFGEAWPMSIELQGKADTLAPNAISKNVNAAKDTLNMARKDASYLKNYEGKDNTYAWWASIVDLRLENALLDLNIPIFIGQGSEDLMAPPISAQKLNEDFIKKGKTNLHYKVYQGYTHEFSDPQHKSHLVEVFMEAIKWMLDRK